MTHARGNRFVLLLLAFAAVSASGEDVVFTDSPLAFENLKHVIPLGNLNPPGHTFPTDHAYFEKVDHAKAYPVIAPAAGTIVWMLSRDGGEAKIMVRCTPTLSYYLDHVIPDAEIVKGAPVTAGARLGVTSDRGAAIDLGVVDERVTRTGFVRPERYPSDTLHAVSPFPLFAEPVRGRLYALIDRKGDDKDGRIDLDVKGRLVGNWFLEGLDVKASANYESRDKHLAFVYDVADPASVRVAIGGTLALTGLFTTPGPDPAQVSRESGPVHYFVRDAHRGSEQGGELVVEMLADDRIRVQAFVGLKRSAVSFDDGASIYER